jgi:hypothetical protein
VATKGLGAIEVLAATVKVLAPIKVLAIIKA